MAVTGMAPGLPELLGMLPMILQLTQALFYIVFIWFFGSLAMKGFLKRRQFIINIGYTLAAGALCTFGAASFAGFVPFVNSGIMHAFQLDFLFAGLGVTVVVYVALKLITHSSARKPEKMISRLKNKVEALEDMLKKKQGHISESTAKQIAEEKLRGYKTKSAKLSGSSYEIILKKGNKEAKAVIDAWDGEIRDVFMDEPALFTFARDPKRLAGAGILAAMFILSAVFFQGFPDPNDAYSSILGMSPDDLSDMASSLSENPVLGANVPEGCISPVAFSRYATEMQDADYIREHSYTDERMSGIISTEAGETPALMIKMDHDGRELVMGVTAGGMLCYFTDGEFCSCIEGISG